MILYFGLMMALPAGGGLWEYGDKAAQVAQIGHYAEEIRGQDRKPQNVAPSS